MVRWWTRSALVLAAAALAASPLLAQPGPGGPRRGGPGPGPGHPCDGTGPGPGAGPRAGRGAGMGWMADQLDLTPEQRTQIRKIRARYLGGTLGDAQDALREAQRSMAGLLHDPATTEEQIRAAHQAASEKALVAALERHRMHAEISQVLTEEQRRKAAELRKNRPLPPGPPPAEPEDGF